jgi:hypothetical protein
MEVAEHLMRFTNSLATNMAVSFAPVSLKMPAGIEELITDFSREVLRSQPANIYTFGADYFKTLLHRREAQQAGAIWCLRDSLLGNAPVRCFPGFFSLLC